MVKTIGWAWRTMRNKRWLENWALGHLEPTFESLHLNHETGDYFEAHELVFREAPEGYERCRWCNGKGYCYEEHDPIAFEAKEMLEFLAGRMEFAGVGEAVAKSYARDIRRLLSYLETQQGDPNVR